jgi:hypothetical protein
LKCSIFEVTWFCTIFHLRVGIWFVVWDLVLGIWDLRFNLRLKRYWYQHRPVGRARFSSPLTQAFDRGPIENRLAG